MKKNIAGKNWEHMNTYKKPTRRQIDATLQYFQDLANKDTNQDWTN